uniref:Uncharacterized protein n=1 Tax=Nelumbo nucifera TaxID=4432 RepID=A0A822Y587_NELNU|nr:TPA_asm: hypothetical protein HUJ06_029178 [Nelumbo nucifera]
MVKAFVSINTILTHIDNDKGKAVMVDKSLPFLKINHFVQCSNDVGTTAGDSSSKLRVEVSRYLYTILEDKLAFFAGSMLEYPLEVKHCKDVEKNVLESIVDVFNELARSLSEDVNVVLANLKKSNKLWDVVLNHDVVYALPTTKEDRVSNGIGTNLLGVNFSCYDEVMDSLYAFLDELASSVIADIEVEDRRLPLGLGCPRQILFTFVG